MDGKRTPFYVKHQAAGARLVDFSGWTMPIQYRGGIVAEHLATRKACGLFDVSHMGRFCIRGAGALPFLQYALTNDASALQIGESQYTILADAAGGAVDDAYLYRFVDHEYLLVVNAANKDKDWGHLEEHAEAFADVVMEDLSPQVAMVAVQGPASEPLLAGLAEGGALPPPRRNRLGRIRLCGADVLVGRTGYTGEPVCFELFLPKVSAEDIWDALVGQGAAPVGLGARDTLRLEAGLPLYGHEFGTDAEGRPIPVFACSLARFAVCLDAQRGEFIGRSALACQLRALEGFRQGDMTGVDVLPRRIRQVTVLGRGVVRAGDTVVDGDRLVGHVTSGTMVPYWDRRLDDGQVILEATHSMRAVALALVDSRLGLKERIDIRVRNRLIEAVIVARNLENRTGPVSYAVLPGE